MLHDFIALLQGVKIQTLGSQLVTHKIYIQYKAAQNILQPHKRKHTPNTRLGWFPSHPIELHLLLHPVTELDVLQWMQPGVLVAKQCTWLMRKHITHSWQQQGGGGKRYNTRHPQTDTRASQLFHTHGWEISTLCYRWEIMRFYWYHCHYWLCLSVWLFIDSLHDSWPISSVEKSTQVFSINLTVLLYLRLNTGCNCSLSVIIWNGWNKRIFVNTIDIYLVNNVILLVFATLLPVFPTGWELGVVGGPSSERCACRDSYT